MNAEAKATPTWAEIDLAYKRNDEAAREAARAIYDAMVALIHAEIERTGAALQIMEVGSVLPKTPADRPLAIRMDVTGSTVVFARQPHVREDPGEKHRSWPIDLACAPNLPAALRNHLIRAVARIADLQAARLL